jgi:hypothetical protein
VLPQEVTVNELVKKSAAFNETWTLNSVFKEARH